MAKQRIQVLKLMAQIKKLECGTIKVFTYKDEPRYVKPQLLRI